MDKRAVAARSNHKREKPADGYDDALIAAANGKADDVPAQSLAAVAQHRNWTGARRNRIAADAEETRGRMVPA